jgi:hypothetical protein
MMFKLIEELENREFRKPLLLCACAIAVWLLFFILAGRVGVTNENISRDFATSDSILSYAMQYKALPRTGQNRPAVVAEEPLGTISQIVDALGLRDKMQQLQSNSSGVTVQLERLYGNELQDFLNAVENGGLRIKTAEIRVLPSGGIRMLNAAFLMESVR